MSQVAYDQDDGDRSPSFAGGSPWFSTLTRKLLWANISVWVATFLLSRFTGFGDYPPSGAAVARRSAPAVVFVLLST